jgi:short-subunit dehydrogenase
MIVLNCLSEMHQCHAFVKRFSARGKGGIVLMGSVLAFMGTPRSANYAATKAYIQSLAEALREELRPLGIDVLASAPRLTASGFAARARMTMQLTMTPRTIAIGSLSALGKIGTVRPGWLSKLLGWSLSTDPRWLQVKIISAVIIGMAPKD